MADAPLRSVIRKLRHLVESQEGKRTLSDAQLIEAFIRDRADWAVEMLVWRHGTMVLNLCRRILQDEHHAQDAFQAAFLVFVRHVRSISKHQSVGSWLYKVAFRAACRLRAKLAKQPKPWAQLDGFAGPRPTDDLIWRDLRPVLDEEIDRLPEKYRAPIVCCYLQGHTEEEADELLGCPQGTIRSRLWRGREQLKTRLTRRGLTLSAGWIGTHLSGNASSAAVPAVLVDITVNAAIEFASGNAVGLASSSVTALTQGVLQAMFMIKLKTSLAIVFTAGVLTMGAGVIVQWALADSHQRLQIGQKLTPALADRVPTLKPKGANGPPADSVLVPQQQKPPNPLPADIVAAWKKAGARLGWMQFPNGSFQAGGEGKVGDMPAFFFDQLPAGVLGQLPPPERDFGLLFNSAQITDAELKGLSDLKFVVHLDIGNTQVTDAGLKELVGLKRLHALHLYGTQTTDAGLKELAGLNSLQILFLNAQVTDAGLKELAGLKSLQQLNLNFAKVSDIGLKTLTELESLQTLYLGFTKVTDAGLKELAGLKSLQELDLSHTAVTNAGLKELAGLNSLRHLFLPETGVTDAGIKELAALQSLKMLRLNGTKVTGTGFKELAGLKSLEELNLAYTMVDTGLKEIAGLKSLQKLVINNTPVTDAGLKELAPLKNLQFLNLCRTDVTDAGLKELAGLKNLQSLHLGNTQISDIGLKELASLTNLRMLSLWKTLATDAGLKELAGLKDLQSLFISDTQVTGAGFKELAGLKSLQELWLQRAQITDAGLKGLAALKSLQIIYLSENTHVTDAGLKELAELKSLVILTLHGTQVTDAGVAELQKALPKAYITK